ncbi:Membrane-associated protease RseP, regulator of RpoE activity [Nocardioides scoriae]|uniref:Membrane-associated protease RseP, regulator of RpoE activity n=1 Tax=Nocardioides scoriae TaxID=642780 RepID=A0A1H1L1T3_9ACTN|nr:site-2 protease family protein [Nocardioides scoriae]SDR68486.1 Membrane-associated protease RseP, regulator of RpoE activity [Nocardioides scoriae]SDT21506.1 Membrane-associated protease RseP, regulator of RpoE activity [Nocardioides scoriae]
MTALFYLLGVLVFVVGLLGSVALHEAGHLIPGKLFNVRVTQFFVGFGRTLWSRQRGETEYGLKAIPLGGYCKLVGMVPPNAADAEAGPDQVRSRATGMFAQLVSDAKDAEYEHVDPHDHDRLFYNKPWWQRVVIMGSGVAINLVLSFLLFAVVFMGYGVYQPTTTISSVSQCVVATTAATADQPPRACTSSDPESPAKAAGFRPGDRFVSINGTAIGGWEQMQAAIRDNGDRTATIVVERDGREVTLRPTTTVTTQATDPEDPTTVTEVGFLGVVPLQERERQGVGYVAGRMVDGTVQTAQTIGTLPARVYDAGQAALGLEERDPNGPMSVVGAGRVAGELASEDRIPVLDRFFLIVGLLAGLNLFLGLVNLLPLPPFDGGGIATTLYETARRRIARARGKPDPGGVDSARLLPLTYAMAAVILLVSVVLIFADVLAPVSLS